MKKLSLIFLVLLFTNSANALVLKNCYVSEGKQKVLDTSFNKERFEKFEFKVFSEGKIRRTIIATDEYLKEVNKSREKNKAEKISTRIFEITYFDEKFIKAKRSDTITMDMWSVTKINVNLNDGSIQEAYEAKYHDRVVDSKNALYKCEVSKSSSKSNYLDYWWAVILIIAITFFIFTQSGKRLKKIRRK